MGIAPPSPAQPTERYPAPPAPGTVALVAAQQQQQLALLTTAGQTSGGTPTKAGTSTPAGTSAALNVHAAASFTFTTPHIEICGFALPQFTFS